MNFYGLGLDWGGDKIVVAVFLFFLLFAAIMTIVMLWHWRRYGFNMKEIVLGEIIYLTGLVILLGGAFYELSFLLNS